MKSVLVGTQYPPESKAKPFRFGYEKKSANSPSIQTRRAEFLSLVLELRANVVESLFQTAYPPFFQLLKENEVAIASLYKSLESEIPEHAYILRQPKYIREQAVEKVIPNWSLLQQREDAEPLRRALEKWAQDHNLTADWCLDHALQSLREFEGSEDRELAFRLPNPHFLTDLVGRAWLSASVERRCFGLGMQFDSNAQVEERGVFSFTFEHEGLGFNVTGPFNQSIPSFKEEVERKFVAVGGPSVRGARKSLQYQQRAYLEKVERITEELGLEEPIVRWAADDHLKWLTHYQLPPCIGYREIGRRYRKDEATIREGVRDIATLIGLKLRSSERGRPKGAQDKQPRHRATKT